MGTHTAYTNTRTFANKSQKHSAAEKRYVKACITIPTEDNTDEEKEAAKIKSEEDLKLYPDIKN